MWVGGLDPGYSDPFAAITAVYGSDEKLHLRRSMYLTQTLIRDVAGHLDRNTLYYCDPAAKREREELEAIGIQLMAGINDVRPGIMKVNELIRDVRIVIPKEEFGDLLSEGATYVFDEKKDEPNRKTPHHLLDCLRYLVMGVEDGGRMEIYMI